jgi:hypothetical protein
MTARVARIVEIEAARHDERHLAHRLAGGITSDPKEVERELSSGYRVPGL